MNRLTKGFGIIGTILIFFGIIGLAITHLMNWYVYLHLGLGTLLIILYCVFNFETFLMRLRERSTTEGGKVALYAAIFVCILVLLNVVAYRKFANKRFDWTEQKIHGIESQTKQLLENLKAPVKVTAFFNAKNQKKNFAKEILETYAYAGKNFKFEFVDPDKQPDLASRGQNKDGDIRFVYGPEDRLLDGYDESKLRAALKDRVSRLYYVAQAPNEPEFLKLRELLTATEFKDRQLQPELLTPGGPMPTSISFVPRPGQIFIEYAKKDTTIRNLSEQDFTNALIQISSQDIPKVYFTAGHGEHALDNEEEDGYSVLKGAIQNEGYEAKKLEANLAEGVPSDAHILVVAGGVTPFSESEANAIDSFLEKGGKAIVLIDPNFSDPRLNQKITIRDTGLEKLLEKWGLEIAKDLVLEKHLQIMQGVTTDPVVYTKNYGSHEITGVLEGGITYFHQARSVRKSKSASADLTVTELVMSAAGSDSSWAETNLNDLVRTHKATFDAADIPGPVSIAASVERRHEEKDKPAVLSKLVVFGDSEFVCNKFIRQQEFNYDLFLNSLNWLWGKKEQISIRPKTIRSSKLVLNPTQTNVIFYAAVLTIPELILIIGLAIYFNRRSK